MIRYLSFLNWGFGSGFVSMYASIAVVETCLTEIVFFTIRERKLCRHTDRCFVWVRVLWFVEISMQILLSSKVLHMTLGFPEWITKPCTLSSSTRLMIAITSRSAEDNAIYSASVVDNATGFYMELLHIIGHPEYIIMNPVREWEERGLWDDRCCQEPAQSASTQNLRPRVRSGFRITPFFVHTK